MGIEQLADLYDNMTNNDINNFAICYTDDSTK